MKKTRHGAWIITIARHLANAFTPNAVSMHGLDNIAYAGRSGSLLVALTSDNESQLSFQKVLAHAKHCGIGRHELFGVLDALKALGNADYSVKTETVAVLAMSRSRVLESTSDLFLTLLDTKLEQAVIRCLEFALLRPRLQSEVMENLSQHLNAEQAQSALAAIRDLDLLSTPNKNERDPIFYNSAQFSGDPQRLAKALGGLHRDFRQNLDALLEQVAKQPGIPLESVDTDDAVLKFAIGMGVVEASKVLSKVGKGAEFLTLPGLSVPSIGETVANLEDDAFHHAKMMLSSFKYGELKSKASRGQIRSPAILVNSLVRNSKIGPCTAIGEDYVVLEAEGVVETERAFGRPGEQYYLNLRRKEPAEIVLAILRAKGVEPLEADASVGELALPTVFRGPDAQRLEVRRAGMDQKLVERFIQELRS